MAAKTVSGVTSNGMLWRVHSDCVVGAGAVVVNDVNENTVVVGVPAKPIRLNRE